MNYIEKWNSMTTEKQLEWLQADVITAAREQIGSNAAWFLEYHGLDHLTVTAWDIANYERINDSYIGKRNAKRETPITLNSIVYGAAKEAIRRQAGADKRNSHTDIDQAENGMIAQRTRTPDRATEDRALIRQWMDELFNGLDETDAQIIKGRMRGLKDNQIAQIVGISPAAICKRARKLKERVTAAM